jgi:hypothetical protein
MGPSIGQTADNKLQSRKKKKVVKNTSKELSTEEVKTFFSKGCD